MDIQEVLRAFENSNPSVSQYVTTNREYTRVYFGLYRKPLNVVIYIDNGTGTMCKDPADFEKHL